MKIERMQNWDSYLSKNINSTYNLYEKDKKIEFLSKILKNQDASNSKVLAEQLTYLESEIKEKLFPDSKYSMLIPLKFDPNGYEFTSYIMNETTGEARFINPNATDIPTVDYTSEKYTQPIGLIASGWQHNYLEIQQSNRLNLNLDSKKGIYCREATERLLHKTMILSNDEGNINGLLGRLKGNNLFNNRVTSTAFSGKTAEEIITILKALSRTAETVTKQEKLKSNVLLMSFETYQLLDSKITSGNLNESVIEHFDRINKNKAPQDQVNIMYDHLLNAVTVQTDGIKDLIVAYRYDSSILVGKIQEQFTIHAPQEEGLFIKYYTTAQTSGVEISQPKSISYLVGHA